MRRERLDVVGGGVYARVCVLGGQLFFFFFLPKKKKNSNVWGKKKKKKKKKKKRNSADSSHGWCARRFPPTASFSPKIDV
jgi:hypothetical protein